MKHILLSGLIICTTTSQTAIFGETPKLASAIDSGKSEIATQVDKSIKPTEITDSRAQAIKALMDEKKKLDAKLFQIQIVCGATQSISRLL